MNSCELHTAAERSCIQCKSRVSPEGLILNVGYTFGFTKSVYELSSPLGGLISSIINLWPKVAWHQAQSWFEAIALAQTCSLLWTMGTEVFKEQWNTHMATLPGHCPKTPRKKGHSSSAQLVKSKLSEKLVISVKPLFQNCFEIISDHYFTTIQYSHSSCH